MSYSDLLRVLLIAENQSDKYATHNDGIAALEQAANSVYKNTSAAATTINVAASDMTRYTLFKFSGATGARVVTFPSTTDGGTTNTQRHITVWNNGSYDITVQASTGSGATFVLKAGHIADIYIDHEDVYATNDTDGTAPVGPYDFGIYIPGMPAAAAFAVFIPIARSFTLPVNMAGSVCKCNNNPTATASFTVKKNGTTVGTISLNTSGVATFTMATATSFVSGDVLSILCPSPQDATLQDIGITLRGSRN